MLKLLRDFWHDDRGCVLAIEWVFVASILTLAAIAGFMAMRYSDDTGSVDRPPALLR
ncbi:MAG TPA: hypothetical protein VN688_04315 [Gemmataceae bacterium]|nr:hypothetical protein [Gemmataceae bacterium]